MANFSASASGAASGSLLGSGALSGTRVAVSGEEGEGEVTSAWGMEVTRCRGARSSSTQEKVARCGIVTVSIYSVSTQYLLSIYRISTQYPVLV